MSDEAINFARAAFEPFSQGDFSAVDDVPDEFELVLAPEMPDAGTYRGAAARDWTRAWVDSFDRLTQEPVEFTGAGDNHALIEFIQRGWTAGSDVPVELRTWALWTLKDGALVRARLFQNRTDAFGEVSLELGRLGIEVWNAGGVEASAERLWAPDVVLHDAPEVPDRGVFRGREAVAAHLNDLLQTFGVFQMELVSIEARADYALSAITLKVEGSSSGAGVDTPMFQVTRYRDGRLAELRSFLDQDQARREYERLAGD